MSDLDQVLDAFVADVRSETRAPGASMAIDRAHRRRTVRVAVAAVAAVAVIAAGGGLAAGTLRGSDQVSPIGEPTPSTVQESAEPTWKSVEERDAELDAILLKVPGWTTNTDPTRDFAFHGQCSRNWKERAKPRADKAMPFGVGDDAYGLVWEARFPSEAQAVDAVASFAGNLESCMTTAWRTQPIASNGAVLASTANTVAWIQQTGREVRVLQVGTTDGPPPVDVQVEVAEWLVALIAYYGGS